MIGRFRLAAFAGLFSIFAALSFSASAQPASRASAQFLTYDQEVAQVAPSGEVCQTNTVTTTAKLPTKDAGPDKSIAVTQTSTSIGVLYLVDGKGTSATAFTVPLYTFPGTSGKLKACTVGALSIGVPQTQIYAGAGLSYLLYSNSSGYSVTLYAGLKGFNIANSFQAATGAHQAVFGAGVSIPIKGL